MTSSPDFVNASSMTLRIYYAPDEDSPSTGGTRRHLEEREARSEQPPCCLGRHGRRGEVPRDAEPGARDGRIGVQKPLRSILPRQRSVRGLSERNLRDVVAADRPDGQKCYPDPRRRGTFRPISFSSSSDLSSAAGPLRSVVRRLNPARVGPSRRLWPSLRAFPGAAAAAGCTGRAGQLLTLLGCPG